jgi:hypothetical protein
VGPLAQEADTSLQAGEKDTLYDQRNGVRCIKISPNGKHLASGDRAGNIRYRYSSRRCKDIIRNKGTLLFLRQEKTT